MQQTYLEIARNFVEAWTPECDAAATTRSTANEVSIPDRPSVPGPLLLEDYRRTRRNRRCVCCGFALSVVARGDVCGRCASPPLPVWPDFKPTYEAQLRGQILATLDRSGYPRLRLNDNSLVGPGLLAWGPVLREMDTHDLERLHLQLSTKKTGTGEVGE